ncbi:hypothetical protein SDC9_139591 [bioreactor metagenome]|uniref:Uncharacterized protein n=1 Tax=bioreactor metagenome TaxID=1076179 RepID=A0A645DSZ8_9ZZZZ
MYHSRFKGRHYEAGFQWGTRLYQHGLLIMDNHLIDLSPQRHAFSRQCLAVYEKWYPAVLAEIRGIADGQHADFEALCTFLLSMYCFTFTNKCTCLASARRIRFSSAATVIFWWNWSIGI